jgi:hypothetical protein
MSEGRTTAQRIADTKEHLARNGHGWLATASKDGAPHMIAVSVLWTSGSVLVATRADSPTARNLRETALAKLALGDAEDAVLMDLAVADRRAAGPAAGHLGTAFIEAMGWDPADEGVWDYFLLRPTRIQAYRGYGEREGSTIMRDGHWLA